ncbi:MAG: 6-phosphofructokinase [Clostridiales Family XIII bacterium]|jgi:6-phosphofructokinase 1|nr:6-phosphofructokinase [Clostridiales Family XIII bacterium]
MRFAILTSGGDAPGMNACIRAITRTALKIGHKVFGVKSGYEGLMEGILIPFTRGSVSGIIHRGGTILKTSRSEFFMTDEGKDKAVAILEAYKIDALFVIGGNGSLTGALALAKKGINVIGLPGTIDNDLAYTDFTIGFDTAVNTATDAISNIRDTSSAHDRTTILEVMGRNCGDIAIYSALAGGAELVLIPEVPLEEDAIVRSLLEDKKKGKESNIIVKAEGYEKFSVDELKKIISEKVGLQAQSVILSYIQRGGSPTAFDRILASRLGARAVVETVKGNFGTCIGIKNHKIIVIPIDEALKMQHYEEEELFALLKTLAV